MRMKKKKSGNPTFKRMKGIPFLPYITVFNWKRKSLLPSNENFVLMKTPLGTFAIVKAQGNGNGKRR